jgi:hypothetical protein
MDPERSGQVYAAVFPTEEHGRTQIFFARNKSEDCVSLQKAQRKLDWIDFAGRIGIGFATLSLSGKKTVWRVRKEPEILGKKRGVSYSYRTATTSYLCYVPVLED